MYVSTPVRYPGAPALSPRLRGTGWPMSDRGKYRGPHCAVTEPVAGPVGGGLGGSGPSVARVEGKFGGTRCREPQAGGAQ